MEPSPAEPIALLRERPAEPVRALARFFGALALRALPRVLALRLGAAFRVDFARDERALIPPRRARDRDDFARELDAFRRLDERPRDEDDRDFPPLFRVAISTPFFHSLPRVHSGECKNQFQRSETCWFAGKVLIILRSRGVRASRPTPSAPTSLPFPIPEAPMAGSPSSDHREAIS